MKRIIALKSARACATLFIAFIGLAWSGSFGHAVSAEVRETTNLKDTKPEYVDSITTDEEEEKLVFPVAVFSDPTSGEIYVLDTKDRTVIYTQDLYPIFTIGPKQGIFGTQALTVDADGYVYLALGFTKQNEKRRIAVLDPRLKWERDILLTGFENADQFAPYSIALDAYGNLIVAGYYDQRVIVIDKQGRLIEIMNASSEGKLDPINHVNVTPDGRILLVSEESGHIHVYDKDRRFLMKFGEKGGSSGKLSRAKAVAYDPKLDLFFVVDHMRHTVLAYNKDGKFLFEFGGLGWGEGWFQYPRDIAIDRQGRLIVADPFNNRVQILKFREAE